MSQCSHILGHLKRKPITALEALGLYGCFRLAARINDLRSQGHKIRTDLVTQDDKRFAIYSLEK